MVGLWQQAIDIHTQVVVVKAIWQLVSIIIRTILTPMCSFFYQCQDGIAKVSFRRTNMVTLRLCYAQPMLCKSMHGKM